MAWLPAGQQAIHRVPGVARHLGLGPEVWRVLARGHDQRNLGEYEGHLDIDERFVTDLVAACAQVAAKIDTLPPPKR